MNKLQQQTANLYPNKHTGSGGKTIVVLPSPVQKKDFNDYRYALNIDQKLLDLALPIAERLASSMVRETLNLNIDMLVSKIVEQVTSRIIKELPAQQTIIQQVVSEETASIKKKAGTLVFDKPNLVVEQDLDSKIQGKTGKKTTSLDSTDDILDALANL